MKVEIRTYPPQLINLAAPNSDAVEHLSKCVLAFKVPSLETSHLFHTPLGKGEVCFNAKQSVVEGTTTKFDGYNFFKNLFRSSCRSSRNANGYLHLLGTY